MCVESGITLYLIASTDVRLSALSRFEMPEQFDVSQARPTLDFVNFKILRLKDKKRQVGLYNICIEIYQFNFVI